jgi:hypothetical protein
LGENAVDRLSDRPRRVVERHEHGDERHQIFPDT